MAKLARLRTREEVFLMLERTYNEILQAGLLCDKAGTICNIAAQARALITDIEDQELLARVEGLENEPDKIYRVKENGTAQA